MSAIQERMVREDAGAERVGRLIAVAACVAGLALLAAFGGIGYGLSALAEAPVAAVHSLDAVVRSPGRDARPPQVPIGWRHTPTNAVIFYAGYFCATVQGKPRVRLVLTERDLDTLTQGSTRVVGPIGSKARTGGMC